MEKIVDLLLCNGCHTCYISCPKNCINMIINKDGFLEPSIEQEKCIDCKLCIKKCPLNKKFKYDNENIKPIAKVAVNKNDQIREDSSSGGIFTEIASYILNNDGSVYGAAFNNKFEVEHIRIDNIKDIYKLQGSKYVQSKIGDIFLYVKKDLEEGKKVLFTGTPCQIEGLLSFLDKKYNNLYTQDIICHGVPSPKAWNKYINEFEGDIKSISFRDKTYGWNKFSMKIETDKDQYIETLDKDCFLQSFLKNLNLRKSCYNCKFKSINRKSDITLADCWGIENINKEYFDDEGTSLVLIHSNKGKDLYNKIKNNLIQTEIDLDKAIIYNTAINKSVELNDKRDKFLRNIDRYNYKELLYRCTKPTIVDKVKKFSIRLKNKIKRIIKEL